MKLLIVTVVAEYHKVIMQLFKEAQIDNFSESDIGGYKTQESLLMMSSWFPSEQDGANSSMFFSFTSEEKIDVVFELMKAYNKELTTNNPIKAVVVPIEKHI